MIKCLLNIDGTSYYFATEDYDDGSRIWEGRLVNSPEFERFFSVTEKTGNRRRNLTIELNNSDLFFNSIVTTHSFLNQTIELTFDNSTDVTKTFSGKITELQSYGLVISLNVSEPISAYFEQPIPDAQIAYDYYSDQGINENWNAVPIIFGSNKRVRTAWVAKGGGGTAWRFLISAGKNYQIKKVYFDKTVMYDSVAVLNGYQASPEDINIKVRIYRGSGDAVTPEVVDGITSKYPGFSYIEFYDAVTLDYVEPLMKDNKVPEIFVDVDGIANAADSGCETNPAKLIYQLLTNPVTSQSSGYQADYGGQSGENGWGLGVDPSIVDFTQAIADCTSAGYNLEGVIDTKKNASEWIDSMCQACGGWLVEESGKFVLKIEKAKGAVVCAFDELGEVGYDCNISSWKEPELDAQINRTRLFYDRAYESKKWEKRPEWDSESPAGSSYEFLRNAAHAVKITKWNTSTLELELVRDDITAHKLAQIYFKRDILQLKTIEFTCGLNIPESLDQNQVITVTSAKFGWTAKQFYIERIKKGENFVSISAKEYDSSVYTYETMSPDPLPLVENNIEELSTYTIPPKPTLASLTTRSQPGPDGISNMIVDINATKPAGYPVKSISFYRSMSTDPATFTFFASSDDGYLAYVWDKPAGDNYYIRAASVNAIGVTSPLAIEAGDQHYYDYTIPEEKTITQGGSSSLPTPNKPYATAILHGVYLYFDMNTPPGTMPTNFSHWKLERNINSLGWIEINDNVKGASYTDIDPTLVYQPVKYRVKAVTLGGGTISDYSPETDSVTPERVNANTDDIEDGTVTSGMITSQQIIAKDFRTALNVGPGVTGLKFDATGIYGYAGPDRNLYISTDGTLCAVNACISGHISATTGTIGGWTIGASTLYSNNIDLCANGTLQTRNFVSGNRGWCISCTGDAEFNAIRIRGELKATTFVYEEINAVGGQLIVTNTASLLNDADTSLGYIDVKNPPSGSAQQFFTNDIVRLKSVDPGSIKDSWFCITGASPITGGYRYNVGLKNGSHQCFPKDQPVIDYGQANSAYGGIMINGYQNPNLQIYTNNTTPWLGVDNRVVLGHLGAWGVSDYGIGMGVYGGSNYAYYTPSTGLIICGTIYATSGKIANWCIQTSCLCTTIGSYPNGSYSEFYNGGLRFWCASAGVECYNFLDSGYQRLVGYNGNSGQILYVQSKGNSHGIYADVNNVSYYSIYASNTSGPAGYFTTGSTSITLATLVGYSTCGVGVAGYTSRQCAIFGCSYDQVAGYFEAQNNVGFFACARTGDYGFYGGAAVNYGVYGKASYYGVYGCASSCYGVVGCAHACYGGYFNATSGFGMVAFTGGSYAINACAAGQYGGNFNSGTWPSIKAENGIQVTGQVYVSGTPGGLDFYAVGCGSAVSWINRSSKTLKENFRDIQVLESINKLPIQAWNFKYEHDKNRGRGIGPYAEDVYSIFGLGTGFEIPELSGIALKGIQELIYENDKLKSCIDEMNNRIIKLETKIGGN